MTIDHDRDAFEEAFGGLPDCLERSDGYNDSVSAYLVKNDVADKYGCEGDQIRFNSGWEGWKARAQKIGNRPIARMHVSMTGFVQVMYDYHLDEIIKEFPIGSTVSLFADPEAKQLCKDAERYRWIKAPEHASDVEQMAWTAGDSEDFDKQIDDAIVREKAQ